MWPLRAEDEVNDNVAIAAAADVEREILSGSNSVNGNNTASLDA